MMMKKDLLIVALISVISSSNTEAYSTGAGGNCRISGRPAVDGLHLENNVTDDSYKVDGTSTSYWGYKRYSPSGTLFDAGYEILLSGVPVDENENCRVHKVALQPGVEGTTTSRSWGYRRRQIIYYNGDLTFDVTVKGPKQFRGIFIRIDGTTPDQVEPSSSIEGQEQDGEEEILLQVPDSCMAAGVGAVTHMNNELKDSVTATVSLDEPTKCLKMDITLVVQNSDGISTYHYVRIYIDVYDDVNGATIRGHGGGHGGGRGNDDDHIPMDQYYSSSSSSDMFMDEDMDSITTIIEEEEEEDLDFFDSVTTVQEEEEDSISMVQEEEEEEDVVVTPREPSEEEEDTTANSKDNDDTNEQATTTNQERDDILTNLEQEVEDPGDNDDKSSHVVPIATSVVGFAVLLLVIGAFYNAKKVNMKKSTPVPMNEEGVVKPNEEEDSGSTTTFEEDD